MEALLGEPGGGGASFAGGPEVLKGRLWGRSSLFIGARLGNLDWPHQPGTQRYG
jgi:hypothetical protein